MPQRKLGYDDKDTVEYEGRVRKLHCLTLPQLEGDDAVLCGASTCAAAAARDAQKDARRARRCAHGL